MYFKANHSRFHVTVVFWSLLLGLSFAVPAKAQTISRDWFQLFYISPHGPSVESNMKLALEFCEAADYTCVLYQFLNSSGQDTLVMIAQRSPEPDCGTMPWLGHCVAQDDNNECSAASPNPQTDHPIVLASAKKYLIEQDARTARPDGVEFSRSYNYRPSPQNPAASYRKLWSLGPEQDRIDYSLHEIAYAKLPLAVAEIETMPEGIVHAVYRPYDYMLIYLNNRPFYVRRNLYTGAVQIPDPKAEFVIQQENPTPEQGEDTAIYRVRLRSGEIRLFSARTGRILQTIAAGNQPVSYTYTPSGHGFDNITMTDAFGHNMSLTYESGAHAILRDAAGQETHYFFDNPRQANPRLKVVYPDDTPDTLDDNPVREYEHISAYDAQGKPTVLNGALNAVYDNGQLSMSYHYNPVTGMPIREEKAGGIDRTEIAYTRNSQNKVTQTRVTNPLGRTTAYNFSTIAGRQLLTRVDGQDSCPCAPQTQSLGYDANGYLASKTDFNGNITRYTHNADGLELQRTEAFGTPQQRIIDTAWHPAFHQPTRISEPGRITEYTYDAQGNRLTETIIDTTVTPNISRTTIYTYNSNGQVLTVDGPRGDVNDVTTFEYDAQGNRIRMINALNQVTEIPDYDAHGNPLRIVDPNGIVTTLAYDARQKLKSRTVAAGTPEAATTRFEYDGVGNLRKIIQPNGAFLLYHYDAAYRLTGIEDNFGNRIEYTLDLAGNRKAEQTYDPDGNLVKTQSAIFNSLSRMTESIGAAGSSSGAGPSITHYRYDNNGNQTEITDPKNQTTISGFDALNRLIRITDTAGSSSGVGTSVTEYTYNALDQLTGVEDPKGLITEYRRNAFGETREQISPDTGITHYQYDPAGNQIGKTDARGITVTYRYDALNRLTDIEYPDPSENIRYVYDQGANGIGRLSRIEDQSGITEYRYDTRGNVSAVIQEIDLGDKLLTLTTQYDYDLADNIIRMTYPSGRIINHIRDPLGRIVRVDSDGRILADSIGYLPFGPLKSLTYGNGLTETRGYDLDYRITGINVPGVHGLSYGYDPNSNIEQILNLTNPAQNQSFGYDTLDRLTSAAGGYGALGYSYDPLGNRLQEVQTAEGTEHKEIYQYGTQNHHLFQRGNINYQYDAVGNTVHNGAQAFIYNQMNRLSRVEQDGTQIAEYRYNALGQRTSKTTGTVDTTDYLALAEEQEALAEQYHGDATTRQDQADALEMSVEDLEQQASDKQFEAGNLRTLAATDRTEAEALEAEAVAAEANGQTWNTQAQSFRNQIVQPPPNFIQRLLNTLYTLAANVAQAVADYYIGQANTLRAEAQALRGSADLKEQEATTLETEAAQLLTNAQQARTQADQLSNEAEALIALAESAEGLAEEYRQLAENPPQTQAITLFVYNQSGQLIGEYDREGNTIKEYAWLDDKPLAMLQNDNAFYYHADHLNTPQMITDQQQAIAWKAEYKPFGEVGITINTVENNLRFPGQYFDQETGLSYNYQRYYSQDLGRYITSDPIGLASELNTYAYVGNNPIIYSDPLGLYKCMYSISAGTMSCFPNDSKNPPFQSNNYVSGNNDGCQCQNNPYETDVKNKGPIPMGTYTVGSQRKNSSRRDLTPSSSNNMMERGSFQVHGCSNAATCSKGCIAATNNATRDQFNNLMSKEEGDNIITVIP